MLSSVIVSQKISDRFSLSPFSYDCTPLAVWSDRCSLVGVESPSHAIRADADPLARSATSIVITLADKYTYDCPVIILIYPSGRSHRHQP